MNWKNRVEKLTNWELWPFQLRYLFITPFWFWFCLRSRSIWFFSSSNPTLSFGGFEGEDKKEMYELLPPGTYPKTIYINPALDFDSLRAVIEENKFFYPFVVKPDVGMKGLLFRKIDSESELRVYHEKNLFKYLVQELVDYPLEVSIFYYRYPYQQKGTISGFIQKELMEVRGDGKKNLLALINSDPQAKRRSEELRLKHQQNLQKIIPVGEPYFLTYAANLNRGARFTNLENLIDEALIQIFDQLSHHALFFYGRYDIKCSCVEDLKRGCNFSILEFNGSGAEPNHVYQSGFSLWAAYKIFLHHWKVLYGISKYNNENGYPYWPFLKGWKYLREARKHLAALERIDKLVPV
ncbi:MAG: D-alanine--D-alanine ligase [Flavisolibacter sp.]